MKLRNLMYATMIACAFASCSKDEVIDNGGQDPVAKGDASLTIQVDANNLVTKAGLPTNYKPGTGEGESYTIDGEASIKNITLVVFNATSGAYLGHSTSAAAETKELKIAGLVPQNIKFCCICEHGYCKYSELISCRFDG